MSRKLPLAKQFEPMLFQNTREPLEPRLILSQSIFLRRNVYIFPAFFLHHSSTPKPRNTINMACSKRRRTNAIPRANAILSSKTQRSRTRAYIIHACNGKASRSNSYFVSFTIVDYRCLQRELVTFHGNARLIIYRILKYSFKLVSVI